MDHIVFIHLSDDGHLGSSHLLANVANAAVSTSMQISV